MVTPAVSKALLNNLWTNQQQGLAMKDNSSASFSASTNYTVFFVNWFFIMAPKWNPKSRFDYNANSIRELTAQHIWDNGTAQVSDISEIIAQHKWDDGMAQMR
jgi:hypothetical protein